MLTYTMIMIGDVKGHLGFFKKAATPVGRGFDSSFGYFCGDSTHDTRGSQVSHTCKISVTDLYNSTRPANTSDYATNRVYNTHMYAELASEVIHAHDTTKPFFLYMAFQNAHAPYQAPDEYLKLYPDLPPNKSQQCFNAMVSAVDVSVGIIADALTRTGMYDNSILIYSSDNGGPAQMSNNMYGTIPPLFRYLDYPAGGEARPPLHGRARHHCQGHPESVAIASYLVYADACTCNDV